MSMLRHYLSDVLTSLRLCPNVATSFDVVEMSRHWMFFVLLLLVDVVTLNLISPHSGLDVTTFSTRSYDIRRLTILC